MMLLLGLLKLRSLIPRRIDLSCRCSFTGGNAEGTKYAGGRDIGSLADYIRTHTSSDEL
jgi:hypothetical protein